MDTSTDSAAATVVQGVGPHDAVASAAPSPAPTPAASPVHITVQNLSTVLTDAEAEAITAALQVQATRDYNSSCWVTEGLADRVGSVTFVPKGQPLPPDTWHIELLDISDQPGALAYHEDQAFKKGTAEGKPEKSTHRSSRGLRADAPALPLAKIFCKTTQEDGGSPSEAASHEMLEALGDPDVVHNFRTVHDPITKRIYPVELCDPVQESAYEIGAVKVSNFCTPAYFRLPQSSNPEQYDWQKVLKAPVPAMTLGGYLSYAPEAEPENWQQESGTPQGAPA
jgi:hypothetical protein